MRHTSLRNRKVGELTLVDSAGDLVDDNVKVDVVHVETGSLINEAGPNLLVVDGLSGAVPLHYILYFLRLLSGFGAR
jgi:hypothetical protein